MLKGSYERCKRKITEVWKGQNEGVTQSPLPCTALLWDACRHPAAAGFTWPGFRSQRVHWLSLNSLPGLVLWWTAREKCSWGVIHPLLRQVPKMAWVNGKCLFLSVENEETLNNQLNPGQLLGIW